MGTEIERKFLVCGDGWRTGTEGHDCRQGYLCTGPPVAVRVRIMGENATLNIKRAATAIVRDEFEYSIPVEDAEAMLEGACEGAIIEKTRYKVRYDGLTWEIDVFRGANAGLVVAEIELDRPDQPFEKPPWAGAEVSGDPRYYNAALCRMPYTRW